MKIITNQYWSVVFIITTKWNMKVMVTEIKSDTCKIQLTIAINFINFEDTIEYKSYYI